MSSQYIFDKDDIKFRKKRTSVWAVLRRILVFFVATASMAVLYYLIFALFFSTEEQQRLRDENRMYEKEYPELQRKEELVSDVIEGLRLKDDRIYEEIFSMSAPDLDPISSVDFLNGMDSIPDTDIVVYAERKLDKAVASAGAVEANFARIMKAVTDSGFVMPPMTNPLENFSFAQTGASVGEKINPFYKVPIMHNGLDMIAPSGAPVYAAADGVVKNVIRSRKGLGNVVEIDHGNGYVTRYAHLADVEVRKGRELKKGARIGYVGVSGNSFAPHLHYEVLRDTLVMDPVNHLFASVTPDDYVNMLIMAVSTGQSLD
ncbi:MAG: M23 family metallopeptidase [Bacteroidales bacterium]|nr:M23 family metallopeptidase [Bacteroidales bacterium]